MINQHNSYQSVMIKNVYELTEFIVLNYYKLLVYFFFKLKLYCTFCYSSIFFYFCTTYVLKSFFLMSTSFLTVSYKNLVMGHILFPFLRLKFPTTVLFFFFYFYYYVARNKINLYVSVEVLY